MPTVLIADDDIAITDMLGRTLACEGYGVMTAANGREALDQAMSRHPDVIVLDWMMPELDGLEVARQLRTSATAPILMLTARDTIEDRVMGLYEGADDYLIKPFAAAELVARIRSLLRRCGQDERSATMVFQDLALNPLTRETRRGVRSISLSPREFDLLSMFLRHPRQVLSRARILDHVWGFDFDGNDSVLDVYIGYLRAKLEHDGEPRLLQTVRGVGYVLRNDNR